MQSPNTGKAGTKVFWNKSDWQRLAGRIETLQYGTPSLSRTAALERAQLELLPEERRRKIGAWSVFAKKLDPLIDEARQCRRENESARVAPLAVAPSSEAVAAQRRNEQLAQWLELTAELFAPFVVRLLQHSVVHSELQKLAPTLPCAPVLDTFSSAFSSAQQPVEPRKPRILVAGLLPAQAGEVSSELAEMMEFRFWSTDESKDKLRTLAKNCQVAVGVTNFLSHSADASLASLAPRYVRHSGGISRLKDTLRAVLQN